MGSTRVTNVSFTVTELAPTVQNDVGEIARRSRLVKDYHLRPPLRGMANLLDDLD